MARNGRARKRKRTNDSKAVAVIGKAIGQAVRASKRGKRRKKKNKFQKKTGAPNYNMSKRALRKILGQFCPPQLNFSVTNNSGLPPIHRCRQVISAQFSLTGTGVSYPAKHFHVNSAYNCMNFGVGVVQAPGYDRLITIYDRSIVLSASLLLVPLQSSSNDSLSTKNMRYWIDNTQLTNDRADSYVKAQNRGLKMGYIDSDWAKGEADSSQSRTTLKKSHKIVSNLVNSGGGEIFGEKGSAGTGIDPTVLSTMSVYICEDDGSYMDLAANQWFTAYIVQDVVYYAPSLGIQDA